MNNPEPLEIYGTQDTGRRRTKQREKPKGKQSKTKLTKKQNTHHNTEHFKGEQHGLHQ
jgi:hypothetical protein